MENIQVIERAFKLLEAVAEDTSKPRTLGELIELSALKPATAARIVKTLANLGYLEQLGRRKGYILGRMAFDLTKGNDFSLPLVKFAKPLMQEFSNQTGEYICLSGLRDGLRVIFHHILSTRPIQISGPIDHSETPYRSASGQLLLSFLSPEEQELFFNRNGHPGAFWPSVKGKEDFLSRLKDIRAKGKIIQNIGELTSIAVPVLNCGKVVAAIGVFLPTYRFKTTHRQEILRSLEKISQKISDSLGVLFNT